MKINLYASEDEFRTRYKDVSNLIGLGSRYLLLIIKRRVHSKEGVGKEGRFETFVAH